MELQGGSSTVLLQQFLADPKNQTEFGKFDKKYRPRIKRCCQARGLQDADADDLAAMILLRFFEKDVFVGREFQTKSDFYRWLNAVVKNAVLSFVRARGRKPDAWSVGNPDAQEQLQREYEKMTHDLDTIFEDYRTQVEAARERVLKNAEEKTRLAFLMSVVDGLPADEVAKRLGMSREAVWKLRSRTFQKIRAELRNLLDSEHEKE
jgi:RNA polymerase sigma factor (sigma-70 family)